VVFNRSSGRQRERARWPASGLTAWTTFPGRLNRHVPLVRDGKLRLIDVGTASQASGATPSREGLNLASVLPKRFRRKPAAPPACAPPDSSAMQCSIGVYLVAGGKQIRDLCTASSIARHENFS